MHPDYVVPVVSAFTCSNIFFTLFAVDGDFRQQVLDQLVQCSIIIVIGDIIIDNRT